ncbi:HPP family protein [Leptospira sp. WS92.C1]
MFFWISRGVSETYIPPARPEIVQPLHPILPSAPSKKIETEEKETPERKSFSNVPQEIAFQYKVNASLSETRSKMGEFLSALTAGDLLTSPVVSFSEQDSVERAEEIFFQKRFRHVPILDEKSTLCGILSDRDWMRWKLTHVSSETEQGKTIGQIMKTRVLSVHRNAGIGEIAKVLFEERIGCLPVVNERIQVIGIITRSDVLRAILKVNEREFLA